MVPASSPSKLQDGAVLATTRVSVVRVAVLGPPGAGVSSLVRRFVSDAYDERPPLPQGLGARFHSKMLLTRQQLLLRFQIWDVPAGDEVLAPVYFATASVCVVCFDLSRSASLSAAALLLGRIASQEHPNAVSTLVLVGCKADAVASPEAMDAAVEEAGRVAQAHGCAFFAGTSAARDRAVGSAVQHVFVNAALVRERAVALRPPPWVPDADRSNCVRCDSAFTRTLRRHHCRACGDVYCAACTAFRPLPRFGLSDPVRVCLDCVQLEETSHHNS